MGGNTDKGVEQTQRHYKKFACSFWHLWLLWQVREEHKPQVDRKGESKMVWERESKWERVSELKSTPNCYVASGIRSSCKRNYL